MSDWSANSLGDAGRALIEVMKPILMDQARLDRALAYYDIEPNEVARYSYTRDQLIAASRPWIDDHEARTIRENGNAPTPGAKAFGAFWRTLDMDEVILKKAWANTLVSARLREAEPEEAEEAYRGYALISRLGVGMPEDADTIIRVGQMTRDGIDPEYIIAALDLTAKR
jgi:hypothetical protein